MIKKSFQKHKQFKLLWYNYLFEFYVVFWVPPTQDPNGESMDQDPDSHNNRRGSETLYILQSHHIFQQLYVRVKKPFIFCMNAENSP